MTRTELRAFLKAGVDALNPATEFGYGQLTDFNSKRDNQYPIVWWVTREGTSTEIIPSRNTPIDSWPVRLIIGYKDKMDAVPVQFEDLVDTADLIGQKLAFRYNQIVTGYKLITINGITRTPFIKKNNPDVVTGIELSFTINSVSTVTDCT